MSIHVMNLVWKNAPFQGNTLIALLALADWSDDDGKSWPSVATLAKKSRQSESNCHTVIRKLKKSGVLKIVERVGSSNLFIINMDMLGVQSLHPAKKSKRGGQGVQSLPPLPPQSLHPDTSLYTPQDQDHTPTHFVPQEQFTLIPPDQSGKNKKPIPAEIPEWLPAEEWAGYVEMRSKIRHPLTDYAKKLELRALDRLRGEGHYPAEVLRQSIQKSYRGLFAVSGEGKQNGRLSKDEERNERNKRNILAGLGLSQDGNRKNALSDGAALPDRSHGGND